MQARHHVDLVDGAIAKIRDRSARVGVIGLGYVGLPLAVAAAKAGFQTVGFDVDADKLPLINRGQSYIDAIRSDELSSLVEAGRLHAADMSALVACDVAIVCVPTPLTRHREPDLSFVRATMQSVADRLRRGQIIVLESTTYPGTTRELVKPILEAGGLRSRVDFFLGFSPEREDPGNSDFATASIPKVVAGDGDTALRLVTEFYSAIVDTVVPVSSTDVAEAVKITENVFRSVNIALVNELKIVFDRMGIDVWEVVEAAKTKPFGFMPFYPGPGLGGHCIPIDPFYLTWKSREYGVPTRFIELAGEINTSMPSYVVARLEEALDRRMGVSLGSASVLVIGLSYKKNVRDIRQSPSLEIMKILRNRGTRASFYDPYYDRIPRTRDYPELIDHKSVQLTVNTLSSCHAVLIITDHDCIDYQFICSHARLVVDTRNACSRAGLAMDKIVKA